MKERYVIVTIDTITELLKDYCGDNDIPTDARSVKLLVKPEEGNKLAIEMIADKWPTKGEVLAVNFRTKRVYGV